MTPQNTGSDNRGLSKGTARKVDRDLRDQAHRYVLQKLDQVQPFIE